MDKYLNEDAITAEIMSYVKNRIYNYAVLIDGDWGTGKTYFIQKSIIPTLEGSGYMPIYIITKSGHFSQQVLMMGTRTRTNGFTHNQRPQEFFTR